MDPLIGPAVAALMVYAFRKGYYEELEWQRVEELTRETDKRGLSELEAIPRSGIRGPRSRSKIGLEAVRQFAGHVLPKMGGYAAYKAVKELGFHPSSRWFPHTLYGDLAQGGLSALMGTWKQQNNQPEGAELPQGQLRKYNMNLESNYIKKQDKKRYSRLSES